MNWVTYFIAGFTCSLGALCALGIFSIVALGSFVLLQVISGILNPTQTVSEYHLHTDGEDNETGERNGHDRFPRN
jgi:hypothetical protein